MATAVSLQPGYRLSPALLLLAAGILALLLPSFISLATQVWTEESGIHGPIVLATGAWLLARRREEILRSACPGSGLVVSIMLPVFLLLYVLGRAFDFLSIEVAALLCALLTVAYSFVGWRVLQMLWFPIFYLFFLVPLPGWFIDYITAPLKELVSQSAQAILSAFGYQIVRQGVTLFIDQYQLLVEDACAGLNSLISLISVSLFYIYLLHNASWRYSLFLVMWIVPVAIAANIIRVIILVLITHYWGDAAAQGFLHSTAGLMMFVLALLGIFAIDHGFSFISKQMRRYSR